MTRSSFSRKRAAIYFEGRGNHGLNYRDPDRVRPMTLVSRSAPRLSCTPRRCPRWFASRILAVCRVLRCLPRGLVACSPNVDWLPDPQSHDDSSAPFATRCYEDVESLLDPTRTPRSSTGRPLPVPDAC